MATLQASSSSISSSSSIRWRSSFVRPPVRLSWCSSFSSSFRGLSVIPSPKRRCGILNVVCQTQQTSLDLPAVNNTTWQSSVMEANGPVLVEFWAPWCGPCRMIHPVIAELSEEYAGKIKCFKLNTDESPSIATKYGIRSVPAIIIFVNGEKKDAVTGAVPKTTLTATIEKFLVPFIHS